MAPIRIDGTRTQTLRTVLLAAFAGVAVSVLGFLAARHWGHRGFGFDLPGQLASNITQTANGFTYSQSQGGHTIFTIHAAKIVEFKADEAQLHDTTITLYGPPGSERRDRIESSDFLYNRKTGLVTAKGKVVIDMASPAAAAHSKQPPPDNIHVETSGLTFDQKTGDAQTDAPLSFTLPRASGKAVGGSYNSKTGVLILQSAVELLAEQNGSPSVVHASHAQLLRSQHLAYLLNARGEYQGSRSSADQAILQFRADGTLQHLNAQNNVHGITSTGAEIDASTATADFNTQGQPIRVTAGGGVNFVSTSPGSNMHGNAVQGAMVFGIGADGKPVLQHAQFQNAVSFVLQQNSLGGDPRGSAVREMTASTLDVSFVPGPGGQSIAQTALARGGARVNLHDLPYGGTPRHTLIAGQQLMAQLAGGHQLRQVDGTGGTKVVYYKQDNSADTSTGDTLHATFLPIARAAELPPTAGARSDQNESARLEEALQQGHVTVTAEPAPGAKASDGSPQQPLYAEGAEVSYLGSTDTLHLAGSAGQPPRVHNPSLSLTATAFDYDRHTEQGVAAGDVRGTFLQSADARGSAAANHPEAPTTANLGGAGPVHVVASRAQLISASDQAIFDGQNGAPARMWQSANSVAAPVLEVGKHGGTLQAHGSSGATSKDAVQAVFAGQKPGSGPARVAANTLFYADSTRMADFQGDVVAQEPDGTVHADDAQVFLSEPAATPAHAVPGGAMSQVERLVATGHVLLSQPGRRGTGQKLVYSGADGNYVLTGTASDPPRVTDAQHGVTTGAALLVRTRDNSVEVLNSDAEGRTRRTVTDTRTTK